MDKLKSIITSNHIKTGLLILSIASYIGGTLWYEKIKYKPRNNTQAEVLENNNKTNYSGYYDTTIVNREAHYSQPDTNKKYKEDTLIQDIPQDITDICRLPEIWGVRLPLSISLTGKSFAATLSKSLQHGERDIDISDYTSLLPKASIDAIGSGAICITSARQFLKYHIGHPSQLTPWAQDFFSLQWSDRYNPKSKKSDWSVRYTTHFLQKNDIGYEAQYRDNITNIQAGDMIFVLFAGSNYKHQSDYQDTNPATHIMVGVGTQTITLPKSMFHNIDTNDHDEILRQFYNQRLDQSCNKISAKQFKKQQEHIQKKYPSIKLPQIEVDSMITITGDMTVDEFAGKMCLRFFHERLIQSSGVPNQAWFTFLPTTIYSLQHPEKFFEDPTIYKKSIEFAEGLESSEFILPNKDWSWPWLGEMIRNSDSTTYSATTQADRFFNNFSQAQIPYPLVKSINETSQTMIDEKIKADFPLQVAKREKLLQVHNSVPHQDRPIIQIQNGNTRLWSMISHIDTLISQYDDTLWSQRISMTQWEKWTILSEIQQGFWVFHSDNTVSTIHFWESLQAGEILILHMPSILSIIEKNLITRQYYILPSIPTDHLPIDYYVGQVIDNVCKDRPDIRGILYGIATSESPWREWEYAYTRKHLKTISEQYLWWYYITNKVPFINKISSEWIFQMRAGNYELSHYRQTIEYIKSASFQQQMKTQFHLSQPWEREQYRSTHGGNYINEMEVLLTDHSWGFKSSEKNYDPVRSKKLKTLFNDLITLKFEYEDDDIISLTFATSLAKYDLIDKKKKLIKNCSIILWIDKESLITDTDHRRSLDEIVRMMHTGETVTYKKIIILYIGEIIKEQKLDINNDGSVWSLPDYRSQWFDKNYYLYLDSIIKHLESLMIQTPYHDNKTAKELLSQLKVINVKGNIIDQLPNIQKLVQIIESQDTIAGTSSQTKFLPTPEILYTHPLFKYYIARANIDKKEENVPIWLLVGSSGFMILFILLMGVEMTKYARRKGRI
jgi:hypothetical protein